MKIQSHHKVLIAAILLALAVSLGAMGAHALEKSLSAKKLLTFKTGVNYHFIHSFALMFLAILERVFSKDLTREFLIFIVGILLFSFNCYIYAVSGIKTFAMIVPLGGVAYIIGWVSLSTRFTSSKQN